MTATAERHDSERWGELRVLVALLLAFLALAFRQLAFAAAIVTLVAFLSLPELPVPRRARARAALAVSAVISVVASLWFLVVDAMPGIVAGGQAAAERSALWRLREIVRAQDAMRKLAHIDVDRDGVGSAAFVGELMGRTPLRGLRTLDAPLLGRRYARLVDTPLGPAAVANAYLIVVCLPSTNGGLTARPGDAVDEERAERRFVAYAWPMRAERGEGRGQVYFVDEHERILVSDNRDSESVARWAGPNHPPPCDAALDEATRSAFHTWEDKRPRDGLPGDQP